jgi:hypothetical protein
VHLRAASWRTWSTATPAATPTASSITPIDSPLAAETPGQGEQENPDTEQCTDPCRNTERGRWTAAGFVAAGAGRKLSIRAYPACAVLGRCLASGRLRRSGGR